MGVLTDEKIGDSIWEGDGDGGVVGCSRSGGRGYSEKDGVVKS